MNSHQSLIKPIAFKPVVLPVQSSPYGTTSRCPVSPRQQPINSQRSGPVIYGPDSPQEASGKTQSPPYHNNNNSTTTTTGNSRDLEKMRAKTLSPYELHSNTLDGSGLSYTNSPPQSVNQSTPKIVLYDRKVAPPSGQQHHHHHDDGYISQDCHSGSHSHSNSSHSNTSHGSIHNDSDRSFEQSYTNSGSLSSRGANEERTASFNSSSSKTPQGRGTSGNNSQSGSNNSGNGHPQTSVCGQTPSPSDSGVGELEAMLRDKEAVIQHLRDTMERNETAILQVCAEKEQNWDLELQQAHADWEKRWRQHQQKAFKMEQALLLQLFKLQQERKATKLDLERTKSECETAQAKYSECLDDLKQTKLKLDEVNWELCQKSGEISLLKSQLKDSKDENVNKKNEVISTKSQLKNYQKTSDQKDHEILTLEAELKRVKEDMKGAQGTITSLQRDLESARKEVFNAQQKADLKELQLDMKTKELEKTQSEHSRRINALKSSSPMGAGATKGSQNSQSPNSSGIAPTFGTSLARSTVESPEKPSQEAANTNKAELEQIRAELSKTKAEFQKERDQWLEEKNKVIRYQKHLQLNYVQIYRKNKLLESEVEQLTLDLEKKDLSLMDSQEGGDKRMSLEGEESMC